MSVIKINSGVHVVLQFGSVFGALFAVSSYETGGLAPS